MVNDNQWWRNSEKVLAVAEFAVDRNLFPWTQETDSARRQLIDFLEKPYHYDDFWVVFHTYEVLGRHDELSRHGEPKGESDVVVEDLPGWLPIWSDEEGAEIMEELSCNLCARPATIRWSGGHYCPECLDDMLTKAKEAA